MKKYFQSFIKDIIPVIIGILIALFINNWNEERKERKYLNEILNQIELELKETQDDIETNVVKQRALIDTLSIYLEDEITSLQTIMRKTNGMSMPTIRIHSWQALSNSKIELLEYKYLSNLTSIEDDRALLKEKSKYLMNFLYSNIGEKKRFTKAMLIGLLSDIISTENSILSYIEELDKETVSSNQSHSETDKVDSLNLK